MDLENPGIPRRNLLDLKDLGSERIGLLAKTVPGQLNADR